MRQQVDCRRECPREASGGPPSGPVRLDTTRRRDGLPAIAKRREKSQVSLTGVSPRAHSRERMRRYRHWGNGQVPLESITPDQNYVKRLLPDDIDCVINRMPMLRAGESFLIGDASAMPAIAQIELCHPASTSSDTLYLDCLRKQWRELLFLTC